jgi:N utilization substance protein B
MTSGRTPARVVVNETVELAKHFSTEKAPAFVNALLDKVMKRLAGAGGTGGAAGAVGG